MQEIGTMQVSGPMSSNPGYPKGSIYNPYSVCEFEYIFDHGLWTVGAFVETMGYVMPTLYVTGNSNANPPYSYVDWSDYPAMKIAANFTTLISYSSDFLYLGSNDKLYWKNPRTRTYFHGNQYVKVEKITEMAKYASKIKATRSLNRIFSYGGYAIDAYVALIEGDWQEVSGNIGAIAGSYAGYSIGLVIANAAVILLTPAAPAAVIGTALSGIALSIIGANWGEKLTNKIYEMYEEKFQ